METFLERQTWLPRDNSSVLAFGEKLRRAGALSKGSFPRETSAEAAAAEV
jgi:hypothetical protein